MSISQLHLSQVELLSPSPAPISLSPNFSLAQLDKSCPPVPLSVSEDAAGHSLGADVEGQCKTQEQRGSSRAEVCRGAPASSLRCLPALSPGALSPKPEWLCTSLHAGYKPEFSSTDLA